MLRYAQKVFPSAGSLYIWAAASLHRYAVSTRLSRSKRRARMFTTPVNLFCEASASMQLAMRVGIRCSKA
jgi:hypothetical protein